jgi:hypothetical protein
MKRSKTVNSLLALMLVVGLVAFIAPTNRASASSHREAPLISQDPTADVTDVYAFRSPDLPNTVTLIANWIPLEQPQGGPNFYKFDDSVLYTINIDNVGDGGDHISYQFKFRTQVGNPETFLYNTGPIASLDDPNYNIRQFYDVTRVTSRLNGKGDAQDVSSELLASDVPVPPVNIGPRSTSNYDALANAAIKPLNGGGKVFAGQRDDPFFVDLGSIFDLAGLRPLNAFHRLPLPAAPGVDGVSGYNVHTTALQVPIPSLHSTNGVVGVWAAAYRNRVRIIKEDGTIDNNGPLKQVSRLGVPLTNEILIALQDKDYWNSQKPQNDAQFDNYILNPEPARLENYLYPVLTDTETTNRQDLLAVFHTGIPGFNALPHPAHADELRLNLTITPTLTPNRMGVLAGDFAGFPNGRRLGDDVVDIELQAVACAYGAAGNLVYSLTGNCNPAVYNGFPNNAVGDGVDANDKPFLASFPYMAAPFQGYEARPPVGPDAGQAAAAGFAVAGTGLAGLFIYRRRKSTRNVGEQIQIIDG